MTKQTYENRPGRIIRNTVGVGMAVGAVLVPAACKDNQIVGPERTTTAPVTTTVPEVGLGISNGSEKITTGVEYFQSKTRTDKYDAAVKDAGGKVLEMLEKGDFGPIERHPLDTNQADQDPNAEAPNFSGWVTLSNAPDGKDGQIRVSTVVKFVNGAVDRETHPVQVSIYAPGVGRVTATSPIEYSLESSDYDPDAATGYAVNGDNADGSSFNIDHMSVQGQSPADVQKLDDSALKLMSNLAAAIYEN